MSHGHSHSNGNDHGHSHGSGSSDHGHSHGGSAPRKSSTGSKKRRSGSDHGHSHGSGNDHGHSHAHGPEYEREDEHKLDMEHEALMSGECGGLQRADDAAVAKTARARRGLILVSLLCIVAICVEVAGGIYAHSLAILTDAAHLLSDLAGFLISLFALWFTTKAPTSALSFGFHRAEILGALLSVILIWIVTGVLVWEAVERIKNPEDVNGQFMFYLASGGLAINIIMAMILHNAGHAHSHGGGDHGHSHGGDGEDEQNVNIRSAYIHVIGDACQSVGVMIAAALIWYEPSWRIADPICTFVFSIIVLYTTVQLVRESIGVLMEGTPDGINAAEVESRLMSVPHVVAVHDLHIWSLSLGKPSLSVHLQVDTDTNRRPALVAASKMLARTFGIHHSTIQVEEGDDNIHCNPSSAIANGNDTPATPMPGLIDAPTTPFAPLPSAGSVNGTPAKKPAYGTFEK